MRAALLAGWTLLVAAVFVQVGFSIGYYWDHVGRTNWECVATNWLPTDGGVRMIEQTCVERR